MSLQAEDAGRAAERAQTAQGRRAEALSRLQDVHRQKARQLKDSVEAVQQVRRPTYAGWAVIFQSPPAKVLPGWQNAGRIPPCLLFESGGAAIGLSRRAAISPEVAKPKCKACDVLPNGRILLNEYCRSPTLSSGIFKVLLEAPSKSISCRAQCEFQADAALLKLQ